MYNPAPWQAYGSDCSSPNPMDHRPYCGWDLKVPTNCTGRCHGVVNGELTIGETAFSTNYTVVPLGTEPMEDEDMFDEWLSKDRRSTWVPKMDWKWFPETGWKWVTLPGPWTQRLNPWNAPGSAFIFGNGCGVSGGNPSGCTGGGKGIQLSIFYLFQE